MTDVSTASAAPALVRVARYAGLDGIRAIAVLTVLAYHLTPGALTGGFLGVDVFFVVSGFLITSLLLRERAGTGRMRLGAFWIRRARRLLPALALVVLCCTALAGVIGGDVLVGLGRQLLGAATFTSNWVYIAAGDSYFSEDALALYRNLWSLAVEEQFYLVWPPLLLLVLWIGRRRWGLGIAAAIGVASSIAMIALYTPGADPTRVYFGTDTHAFGLMTGVVVAFLLSPAAAWRRDTGVLRHPDGWQEGRSRTAAIAVAALGAAALVALLAAAVFLSEDGGFAYQGGLLLVSLLTAILVWAGATSPLGRALDNPVLRWIGERSYGIYLWHWPLLVLVFAAAPAVPRDGAGGWMLGGITLALTVLAAAASYRYVEQPVRRHGFRAVIRTIAAASARSRRRFVATGLASLLLLLCFAGSTVALTRGPSTASAEDLVQRGEEAIASAPPTTPAVAATPQWATAPGAVPPPGKPLPAGDRITAIGDSVMLASAPELQAVFPGIAIDAAVSRSMWAGASLVSEQAGSGALRDAIVIGLGTNGPVSTESLEQLRAAAGGKPIVLVNAYAPREWIPGVNETLATFAATYRDVELADWSAAIGGRLDVLAGDQIHPGTEGGAIYAEAVRQALQRLADLPPQRSPDEYGLAGPPQ